MNLRELLKKSNQEAVLDILAECYDNICIESHYLALNELLSLTPEMGLEPMFLGVYKVNYYSEECNKEVTIFSVHGFEPTEKTIYALSYTPWSQWLALEVSEVSLNKFTIDEIVAHCLYEMTFLGYTYEDNNTKISGFGKMINEVEEALSKGDSTKFVSFNDLKKELIEKHGFELGDTEEREDSLEKYLRDMKLEAKLSEIEENLIWGN